MADTKPVCTGHQYWLLKSQYINYLIIAALYTLCQPWDPIEISNDPNYKDLTPG